LTFEVAAGGAELAEDAESCEEGIEPDPTDDWGRDWTDDIDMLPTDMEGPTGNDTVLCADETTEETIGLCERGLLLLFGRLEDPPVEDNGMLVTDVDAPTPLTEL
jgi:hypothetical protein